MTKLKEHGFTILFSENSDRQECPKWATSRKLSCDSTCFTLRINHKEDSSQITTQIRKLPKGKHLSDKFGANVFFSSPAQFLFFSMQWLFMHAACYALITGAHTFQVTEKRCCKPIFHMNDLLQRRE